MAQNYDSESEQPQNTLTRAAHPGQLVTVWATGLGAIEGDDSALMPQDLNLNLQVLVGGVGAKVRYAGRSGCCAGVDEVIFEVPSDVQGSYVPVALRIGELVSNFATISVVSKGDVCTDLNGFSGVDLETLNNGGAIAFGNAALYLEQDCDDYYFCNPPSPTRYNEYGTASFARSPTAFLPYQIHLRLPSLGSCLLLPPIQILLAPASASPIQSVKTSAQPGITYLDAGPALNVSGPKGVTQLKSMSPLGQYAGQFSMLAPSVQFLEPGDYTIDNGSGGADVGPFRANLTVPKAFTYTMQNSADGLRVAWAGGDPAGYAIVQGRGLPTATGVSIGFLCTEKVAAGHFTLPPEIALPTIAADCPDAVLVDIGLPGMSGVEGISVLKQRHPELILIVLTVYDEDDRIFSALCAGACGYLLKKTQPDRLLDAIREALAGGAPMSPEIARRVVSLFREFRPAPRADYQLTPHELRLLKLQVEGHNYKSAAGDLNVTVNTVSFHIKQIYTKLQVHSKSEAVAKALRQRLF